MWTEASGENATNVATPTRAVRRSGRRAASVPGGSSFLLVCWLYTAMRCNNHIFSKSPMGMTTLGEVRTFSLLGEKGEGVVFSRPLRALRAA